MHGGRANIFCGLVLSCVVATAFASPPPPTNIKAGFHIEALFLQPNSNNLKYAVFVF